MGKHNRRGLILTSLAVYFTYLIHGIGASIMGQYKTELALAWGAKLPKTGAVDVGEVVIVIAALGLGRLIALPISGPVSDKLGRRVSGVIGCICYVGYLGGIAFSGSAQMAYAFAVLGGIANSFLDTCVSPTCMEIYAENASVANLFTKFAICIGQFLLPFLTGIVAASHLSYRTIFIVAGIAILMDGVLLMFLPFPAQSGKKTEQGEKKKQKIRLTPEALAAICIGFTSSSTFMLWLNCNQELGKAYGLGNPSMIQSFYAAGTAVAILATAAFIRKGLSEKTILILYPVISLVMLALCYFIQIPQICLLGGFVIGYAGAGGVLQLAVSTTAEYFPESKGTATSLVMLASAAANYTIISLAGYIMDAAGAEGPRMVLLLNMAVTAVGVLLALFVKYSHKRKAAIAD